MEYNMQMLNPHSDCKNYKTMETTTFSMKKGTENIKNLKKRKFSDKQRGLRKCMSYVVDWLPIDSFSLVIFGFRYHEFFVHIFKTKTFCCIQSHCYRKIKLICILSSFLHILIAKFIALVCITFSFDRYKDLKGSPYQLHLGAIALQTWNATFRC